MFILQSKILPVLLTDFLMPVPVHELNEDQGYRDGQIARHIEIYAEEIPDISNADIVILGVTENRGAGGAMQTSNAANVIRKQLYNLHFWHGDVKIADIGNVKMGATLQDSYAAIRSEIGELISRGKKVLILGGSHDIALAQYNAYAAMEKVIEFTNVDAKIDIASDTPLRSDNFLMDIFTQEPNFLRHYNHLAFQSYFVHPAMLDTIDKLRFDCYRAGNVQEHLDDMEPVLRSTDMLTLDVAAIKNSDAPANKLSPNGLTGVEACTLARFAGMSKTLSSFGIYGYNPEDDRDELTAKQISQVIWYFIDGVFKCKCEPVLADRDAHNEFHTQFGEVETMFLQNKRTNRWWMQMPDKKFVPCTHKDYLIASHGDIPERWFRVQERSL